VVTSGTHSPTLKKAIGLAYLPLDKSAPGSEFMVLIRGKETRARVVPTPFYKRAK
jgi:aminomethyltransferase